MSAESSASPISPAGGRDRVRALQRVLYRSAKQDPERRFHALFDKVARSDVMRRAWNDVRANKGAPGVDGISIEDVEQSGVLAFLEGLAAELRAGRYRPRPLRRVISLSRAGRVRPGRWTYRRSRHTARLSSESLRSLVVKHPFHPLCGERLEVLYVRREAGGRVYVCDGGRFGGVSLPEAATDRGLEPAERPVTLEVLCELLAVVAVIGRGRIGELVSESCTS